MCFSFVVILKGQSRMKAKKEVKQENRGGGGEEKKQKSESRLLPRP